MASELIKHISDASFEADVLQPGDVGRKTTQGMPSTSSLVKPLETLQTPTTSVSLSPLKR
jgi:hypothetical protein